MKHTLLSLLMLLAAAAAWGQHDPEFSTAGFYELPGTGRQVWSMNPAWRFYMGDAQGAEATHFDDTQWQVVNLPHGLELLPAEASGCVNYQGPAWYRKHFTPQPQWNGQRLQLHFEAIMGKCDIWLNGEKIASHRGGFTPIAIDVTDKLLPNRDNVLAVRADNTDDGSFPPGKPQRELDFAYQGGIYRDCWMVSTHRVYITDPNEEDQVAGGGLFVSFDQVSNAAATLRLDLHARNRTTQLFQGKVAYELKDDRGRTVASLQQPLRLTQGQDGRTTATMTLKRPHLWQPDDPYLYQLHVRLLNNKGRVVDGYRQRVGVRSIEFKGEDGFYLNGKPYPEPLIGANRHQDFAVVGNALSNSLHYRDAKKLRDAGLRVIRNAHYPQDPAFMDACDELGLFVIVNTPGWQFWNDNPEFAQLVKRDIRQMVRRDRNHPSVWLWEPILNETWYPDSFALQVRQVVEQEYPYPYCYTACDAEARGAQYYKVRFQHPSEEMEKGITYFTREWGDNVDDWSSHNSPSRASRAWGEVPMLVQAKGYARPDYPYTCYDSLYRTTRQHVGGCLWHSFDHQRGYHPDPFYGGIMDNFRQPKYSYYMFMAQRPVHPIAPLYAQTGPMVYVANAMTPFSPAKVTVYSNCDTVRLTYCRDGKVLTYARPNVHKGMPSPIIEFDSVFHHMDDKALDRAKRADDSYILAEGIVNGRVVATHQVRPARRPTHIRLWADTEGTSLRANGSDLVTIVAAICDDKGVIKRLNNQSIVFSVEGPAELVASTTSMTNPKRVEWGTAPVLLRTTTQSGTIRVHATVAWNGLETPLPATLELQSLPAEHPMVFTPQQSNEPSAKNNPSIMGLPHGTVRQTNAQNTHLDKVATQQEEFE